MEKYKNDLVELYSGIGTSALPIDQALSTYTWETLVLAASHRRWAMFESEMCEDSLSRSDAHKPQLMRSWDRFQEAVRAYLPAKQGFADELWFCVDKSSSGDAISVLLQRTNSDQPRIIMSATKASIDATVSKMTVWVVTTLNLALPALIRAIGFVDTKMIKPIHDKADIIVEHLFGELINPYEMLSSVHGTGRTDCSVYLNDEQMLQFLMMLTTTNRFDVDSFAQICVDMFPFLCSTQTR